VSSAPNWDSNQYNKSGVIVSYDANLKYELKVFLLHICMGPG